MGFLSKTKAIFTRKKKVKSTNKNNKQETAPVVKEAITPPESPLRNLPTCDDEPQEPAQIVIVGAGIVGLVLALALQKHCGIHAELYEKAKAFHDDVGAGMGMYPNGLRVIRDISPDLLEKIRSQGCAYLFRRWERHDGTEVAVADEKVLSDGEEDLQTIGIRRWKLQNVLYEAAIAAGLKIHFAKQLEDIKHISSGNGNEEIISLKFTDGTTRLTKLLLGADGSRSQVRNIVCKSQKLHLEYSGVTCLMGTATVPKDAQGICLPSSGTSKCHGAFYPTGENEQCFQFHFPIPKEKAQKSLGSWGSLTETVGQEECDKLAERLKEEGWDEKFLVPLRNVDKALKIGFSTLEPHLESFVYGKNGSSSNNNIALVGDAAHPPTPYLGQGAQQGLEDAGTLTMLMKEICIEESSSETVENGLATNNESDAVLSMARLGMALKLYNQLRVPRTEEIIGHSKTWGNMQQKRAENSKYNTVKEERIRREVFYHTTMPVLFHGAKHDYKAEVEEVLKETPLLPVSEEKSCS